MSVDLSRVTTLNPRGSRLTVYPVDRRRIREMYRQKLVTAHGAVKLIKSGNNVILPLGCGEPEALVTAMGERGGELKDVKVHQMLPLRKSAYMDQSLSGSFRHVSWFNSGANRQGVNEGWSDFMPSHFHDIPKLISDYVHVDVFMGTVSPMDDRGYFSFGLSVDYTTTAASRARIVIIEVNPNMPRTRGHSLIHISEVDYIVESSSPIPELSLPPVTGEDEIIGAYIAGLIEDGSTIQLGIGGMPNAVARALANKHDLGVHTEMITDGMVDLVEAGVINGREKSLYPGKLIGSFAVGTRRLYDFLNENPMVEMYPVSYVNDPYVIGQNSKMVSINASLEVDLFGQCASESIGPVQYSATGGQSDFARGCLRSPGGKGFITLKSTAKKGTLSKIVPLLKQGSQVSCSRNDVDHIVTEYGVAKLRGKTSRERAQEIIAVAHPDFRPELREAARKMGLL